MTQQTINIGSAPNDGTGDTIRDAFDKTNDNFSELYGLVQAGLSWKQAVRFKTTANVDLAGGGLAAGTTHDGVTAVAGDRALVGSQTAGAENGIYIVPASGAPTRADDANAGSELVNATAFVSEGTVNADTQWTCTTNAPITVGTTALAFAQINTGGVNFASASEVNAGSEAAKAISPEALADSNYGRKVVQIPCTDPAGSAITVGDGQGYFVVPPELNGMNLVDAQAALVGAVSTSGLPTIQVHNQTDAVDMLTTKITIDANEWTSYSAAAPSVIDTAADDVATGDRLRVDLDVAGTGAKGLVAILTFQLP